MKCLSLLLTGIFCASAAAADVPARTAPWTLLDQFDNAYTLNKDAKVLLVARSMSTAKLVNAAIESQPAGYLESRHVVYLADIEKMPGIAKLIAIPAMRSAKYRIMLDQQGTVAGRYEGDRDTVQWLELKEGGVAREQRFADVAQLQDALAKLPE